VAENDRRRIDELKMRIDAKQITVEQARAEASLVRENTAQIEGVLAEARTRRDNYLQARAELASSDAGELDREIARLSGEIAELETQLTLVNSSLQVSGLS
jgi:chromosome segregation ATPase